MDYLVMYHSCKDKSGPQQVFREAQGLAEMVAIRMLPDVMARVQHGMGHGQSSCSRNRMLWLQQITPSGSTRRRGDFLTLHRPIKIRLSTAIAQHTITDNSRSLCIS
jgi:hypothetical protein